MKLENNFIIYNPSGTNNCLWIKDALTKESINAIATEDYDGLQIGEGDWHNIDTLLKYKAKIKDLSIQTQQLDWKLISKFTYLESIYIDGWFKCNLEFQKFKNLRVLHSYWNDGYDKVLKDLENLVSLNIIGLKSENLETLGNMPNLKSLILVKSRKISSLKNIANFKKLEYLEIVSSGNLSDYSELEQLTKLRVLYLDNCKKEYDYSVLGQLQNIDKIIITGAMKNFQWVKKLKTLRILRFNCTIEEGDLGFLYDMPNLELIYFNDRRNFSIKAKEMYKYLTEKGYNQEILKYERYLPPTR